MKQTDDYISRQELYNELYNYFHDKDATNNITEVRLGAVRSFVKYFPSAIPTDKIGHWIFSDNAHKHGYCSECHYGNIDLTDGKPHNYCPNCGAEMEKEE